VAAMAVDQACVMMVRMNVRMLMFRVTWVLMDELAIRMKDGVDGMGPIDTTT
jgi:hypothetical protein